MDVIFFQRRQLIKVDCASRIVPDEVTEIARKEIGKVFFNEIQIMGFLSETQLLWGRGG